MKTFFRLLATALVVVTTNNFVWFGVIFWGFLSTKSVISTSTMGGLFLIGMAVSGIWFGSIVDHNRNPRNFSAREAVSVLSISAVPPEGAARPHPRSRTPSMTPARRPAVDHSKIRPAAALQPSVG